MKGEILQNRKKKGSVLPLASSPRPLGMAAVQGTTPGLCCEERGHPLQAWDKEHRRVSLQEGQYRPAPGLTSLCISKPPWPFPSSPPRPCTRCSSSS